MIKIPALAFAATAVLCLPAIAANTPVNAAGGKGLVVVGLNALDQSQIDILRNANIQILDGNTVQVPINVAAVLCNTEVNAIASSNDKGAKSCDATVDGVKTFSTK
jgi:hypothetical protein